MQPNLNEESRTSTLRLGDDSSFVRSLQDQLRDTTSPNLVVDALYGPATLAALHKFQREGRLPLSPSDGTVDACSWNALQNLEAYDPVYHNVPLIAQPDDGTCWAACAAALTNKTVEEVIASTPPELIFNNQLRNYSNMEDWRRLEEFALSQGLELFPPQSWELTAFKALIAEGPIMVDMLTYADRYVDRIPSPGHFVVIVGVRGDGDPAGKGTSLHIQDPLPPNVGQCYSVNFFKWINEMPARTYNVFRVKKSPCTVNLMIRDCV